MNAPTVKTLQIGNYTLRLNIPLGAMKIQSSRVKRRLPSYEPDGSRVRIYRTHSRQRVLAV